MTGMTGGSNPANNFPMANPLQAVYGGFGDAFVAKLNENATELVYSTYLEGSSFDSALGIAVDREGQAYVTGQTESSDFPSVDPLPVLFNGFAAFVAKLKGWNKAGLFYLCGWECFRVRFRHYRRSKRTGVRYRNNGFSRLPHYG